MVAFPQDYHLHTTFSVDGFLTPEELCRRAIEVGTREIAMTDHVDFVEGDISMLKFQPDAFFDALARCRQEFQETGELIIRAGVEIGESNHFGDEVGWLLESYDFDFVIGSLHAANAVFTDQPKDFEDPDYYRAHPVEETYNAYFVELLTLARDGEYDVIGHLDLPKRHSVPAYGAFDPRPFEEPIRAVLEAVVDRGKGIEINTGTARRLTGVPSPDPLILTWYREMGGEILTIGSDGHQPEHIGWGLERGVAMAKEAGFSHLTSFSRRRPSPLPFD